VENTYQETNEFYIFKKAGDMFSAYQDFHKEAAKSSSLEDLSRSLFGRLWRRRVNDQINVLSSRNTAIIRYRRGKASLSL
jgi:hypothetical protein